MTDKKISPKESFIVSTYNNEPPSYDRNTLLHLQEQNVPATTVRFPRAFLDYHSQLEEGLKKRTTEEGLVTLLPIIEMHIEEEGKKYTLQLVKAYLGIELPYTSKEGKEETIVGQSRKAPQSVSLNVSMPLDNIEDIVRQAAYETNQLGKISRTKNVLPRIFIYKVGEDGSREETNISEYVRKRIR